MIDTAQIGLVDFSLGGYTVLAVAGAQIDYAALKRFSTTDAGQQAFHLSELGDVSGYLTPALLA